MRSNFAAVHRVSRIHDMHKQLDWITTTGDELSITNPKALESRVKQSSLDVLALLNVVLVGCLHRTCLPHHMIAIPCLRAFRQIATVKSSQRNCQHIPPR